MKSTMISQREVSALWIPGTDHFHLNTNNSPGAVEFDWERFWPIYKSLEKKSTIVMIHSHPPGVNSMSPTDTNMVYGWHLALDIPIVYGILVDDDILKVWISRKTNELFLEIPIHFDDHIPNIIKTLSEYPDDINEKQLDFCEFLCLKDLSFMEWLLTECSMEIKSKNDFIKSTAELSATASIL